MKLWHERAHVTNPYQCNLSNTVQISSFQRNGVPLYGTAPGSPCGTAMSHVSGNRIRMAFRPETAMAVSGIAPTPRVQRSRELALPGACRATH